MDQGREGGGVEDEREGGREGGKESGREGGREGGREEEYRDIRPGRKRQ